jgi:hypothetical protein
MARSPETPAEVERWFRKRLAELWPVATGCLSLRRSPCVRPNCQACATGEQHASYVLYGRRENGRRFALYVPAELVADVRQAVENGRRLQALMSEAGRRYTEARKHERRRRR